MPNGASFIANAAATLCNHELSFDVDRAGAAAGLIWLDGSPVSLSDNGPALTLGACEIFEPSLGHYRVVWDTGETLDVTDNGAYLDVSASLSWIDGLGSLEGLLSSGLDPDAWRVTGTASLFDPIPEPTTLSLLASALLGLGIIRRRATSRGKGRLRSPGPPAHISAG